MRGARRLAGVLLLGLGGCFSGDTPLEGTRGDESRFGTSARCEECPHLRRFALGGAFRIAVGLGASCEPWTPVMEGGAEITSDVPPEGLPECGDYVHFRATVIGPASLAVRRLDGTTIDTFPFEVAAIGRLAIAPDLPRHRWSPLDPETIEVPLGAVFRLDVLGTTPGDGPEVGAQLLIDPEALTWTIEEGTAVSAPPPGPFTVETHANELYAAALGRARLRVASGAASDTIGIHVLPTDELAADNSPFCFVTPEHCDGLDNDCDGAVDDDPAACASGERCVGGTCVAEP